MRAVFNGTVVAESDETLDFDGNHYFPRSSVNEAYLEPSSYTTVCPWKGTASYQSVTIDGETAKDALWYYPQPKDAAAAITDHVAFWRGVTVTE